MPQIYADFLLSAGHTRIAVATQPSIYWASGIRILRDHIASFGGTSVELDIRAFVPTAVCDELLANRVTALLLLAGHPEPAISIARSVRRDPGLGALMIGAPAGQPELGAWAKLGNDGTAVPFLRYLPERLGPLGDRVDSSLCERLGQAPSFVAFEGYDTIAVLAEVLHSHGTNPARIAASWSRVTAEGARGQIHLSRHQAPASGNGLGRQSKSSIDIRRNPIASESFTPAEPRATPASSARGSTSGTGRDGRTPGAPGTVVQTAT